MKGLEFIRKIDQYSFVPRWIITYKEKELLHISQEFLADLKYIYLTGIFGKTGNILTEAEVLDKLLYVIKYQIPDNPELSDAVYEFLKKQYLNN